MKKVYVAGKINDYACDYIKHMNLMIKYGNQIRKRGYSVFIPCLDFVAGLVDGDLDYEDYFNNNIPWLLSSDAVFVCPNWKTSCGTKKEIELAKQNNIPVFYNLDLLYNHLED